MPLRLAAAACACLVVSLACAGRPQVESDVSHDFASVRRWSWLPEDQHTAPLVADAALRDRLADSIERELAAHGLEHAEGPDLWVSCQVALTREHVLRTETPASTFLSSLGHTPSYEVTASRTRVIEYERIELRIALTDARTRRIVWSARLERRVRGSFLERVDEVVAALLSALPPLAVTPPLEAAARARTRG
jgi:hypothetical protein